MYGAKLADIETSATRIDGGFQMDDGASMKKVSLSRIKAYMSGIDNSRPTKEFV